MFINPPPLALAFILAHEAAHHVFGADDPAADSWANECVGTDSPAPTLLGSNLESGPSEATPQTSDVEVHKSRPRIAEVREFQGRDTAELIIAAARLVRALLPTIGPVAVTAPNSGKLEAFVSAVARELNAVPGTESLEGVCVAGNCRVLVNGIIGLASVKIEGQTGTVHVVATWRAPNGGVSGEGIDVLMRRSGTTWRFVSAATVVVK